MKNILPEETAVGCVLGSNAVKMKLADVLFWLQRFVLEVRKSNEDVYSPDSLYQLCCVHMINLTTLFILLHWLTQNIGVGLKRSHWVIVNCQKLFQDYNEECRYSRIFY